MLLLCFLLLQSVLNLSPPMLWNVLAADIIDDDCRRRRRDAPLSSTFFGLNALVTKPAQSVAPMLVMRPLTASGYRSGGDVSATGDTLREAMMNIVFVMPICVGIAQVAVFYMYSLKTTHMRRPQSVVS